MRVMALQSKAATAVGEADDSNKNKNSLLSAFVTGGRRRRSAESILGGTWTAVYPLAPVRHIGERAEGTSHSQTALQNSLFRLKRLFHNNMPPPHPHPPASFFFPPSQHSIYCLQMHAWLSAGADSLSHYNCWLIKSPWQLAASTCILFQSAGTPQGKTLSHSARK